MGLSLVFQLPVTGVFIGSTNLTLTSYEAGIHIDPIEEIPMLEGTPKFQPTAKDVAWVESATQAELKAAYPSEFKAWENHCYSKTMKAHLDESLKPFNKFLLALGPKPNPDWSLDQIDKAKPLTAENLRWASAKDQAANKSNVKLYLVGNNPKPVSLPTLCDIKGVKYQTLTTKLKKVSIEDLYPDVTEFMETDSNSNYIPHTQPIKAQGFGDNQLTIDETWDYATTPDTNKDGELIFYRYANRMSFWPNTFPGEPEAWEQWWSSIPHSDRFLDKDLMSLSLKQAFGQAIVDPEWESSLLTIGLKVIYYCLHNPYQSFVAQYWKDVTTSFDSFDTKYPGSNLRGYVNQLKQAYPQQTSIFHSIHVKKHLKPEADDYIPGVPVGTLPKQRVGILSGEPLPPKDHQPIPVDVSIPQGPKARKEFFAALPKWEYQNPSSVASVAHNHD